MRLRLLVSEAWRSLGANISTTFAATMTVLVGMFLLGLFIALGTWTVSWSNHVKRELVVKVDFKTNADKGGPATKAQENAVVAAAAARTRSSAARRWKFVSKEQALERMKKTRARALTRTAVQPASRTRSTSRRQGRVRRGRSTRACTRFRPGVQEVDPRQAGLEPDPPVRALDRGDLH